MRHLTLTALDPCLPLAELAVATFDRMSAQNARGGTVVFWIVQLAEDRDSAFLITVHGHSGVLVWARYQSNPIFLVVDKAPALRAAPAKKWTRALSG